MPLVRVVGADRVRLTSPLNCREKHLLDDLYVLRRNTLRRPKQVQTDTTHEADDPLQCDRRAALRGEPDPNPAPRQRVATRHQTALARADDTAL